MPGRGDERHGHVQRCLARIGDHKSRSPGRGDPPQILLCLPLVLWLAGRQHRRPAGEAEVSGEDRPLSRLHRPISPERDRPHHPDGRAADSERQPRRGYPDARQATGHGPRHAVPVVSQLHHVRCLSGQGRRGETDLLPGTDRHLRPGAGGTRVCLAAETGLADV